MEKAKAVFTHEDGREITVNVILNEDDSIEISADFGEEGSKIHDKGLHGGLANILMQGLTVDLTE